MHIKRMVFGNAATDGGEGWRTIRKTAQLRPKEESLIKDCCFDALKDTKSDATPGSIFFTKRLRTLLLLGYGAAQKTDANGRPGGWLFYCCATKPYRRVLADGVPLSRFLFDNSRSWLKGDALELMEKDDQRVAAMIQNAGSKPADFWQELYPVASAMEKMLRMQHKRAKSYLFPADSSDHFDVCRSLNSPALETSFHRAKWPYVVSALLSVVIVLLGIALQKQMKAHQAALQKLRSEHRTDLQKLRSEHQGELEVKDSIIAGKERTIEKSEKDRDRIQSERDTLIAGGDKYVKKAAEDLKLMQEDLGNAIRQKEKMREGLEEAATNLVRVRSDVETFHATVLEQATNIVQSLDGMLNQADSLLAKDSESSDE